MRPTPEVAALTVELIAGKGATRELGTFPLPATIAAFIETEFSAAEVAFEISNGTTAAANAATEAVFRRWVS